MPTFRKALPLVLLSLVAATIAWAATFLHEQLSYPYLTIELPENIKLTQQNAELSRAIETYRDSLPAIRPHTTLLR